MQSFTLRPVTVFQPVTAQSEMTMLNMYRAQGYLDVSVPASRLNW